MVIPCHLYSEQADISLHLDCFDWLDSLNDDFIYDYFINGFEISWVIYSFAVFIRDDYPVIENALNKQPDVLFSSLNIVLDEKIMNSYFSLYRPHLLILNSIDFDFKNVVFSNSFKNMIS